MARQTRGAEVLETALGRRMALSTTYNLLHRHGWRKLAPDKRYPQSDPVIQEARKPPPRNAEPDHFRLAGGRSGQTDVPGRGAFWTDQQRAVLLGPGRHTSTGRAMLTHEYTYAYGAVDVVNGELDSLDALEDQLQTGLLALENVSWD